METAMSRPDSVTLRAPEGEALIERLSIYAPTRADCEMLIEVGRGYFGLVLTVQEAKRSLKRLRPLLFGKSQTVSQSPEAESVSAGSAPEETMTETEASSAVPPASPVSAEAGSQATVRSSAAETALKPRGGQRPGTGRLGADASEGATRPECRHEEWAVGQRCPVCGQGTL